MMQYIFLIYTDEKQEPALIPAEREATLAEYLAFTREARERQMMVAGDELHPTHTATTVRIREGKRMTTAGPFAETKEQLGGFYILNCKDLDEAIEMAAKIPGARHGSIEVRPIVDHSGSSA